MLGRLQRNERAIFGICLAFSFLLLAFFVVTPHLGTLARQYLIIVSLAAITFVAYQQLGLRRDRNYLRNDATFCVVALLMGYGMLAFISGLFLGFNRGYFSTNIEKIFSGLVPVLLLALVVEFLRFIISEQYLYSKRSIVIFTTLTTVMYVLLELPTANLASSELVFIFICATVFPTIAREALCGFLCFRAGIRPAIIFKLVMVLYPYLLPIIPALGNYLHSVANVLFPFIVYLVVLRNARFYNQDKQLIHAMNVRLITAPLLCVAVVLTGLVSGILPFQLIAVASDSMQPVYGRGDAVLFEKVNATEIEKDDILVFSKDRTIVTHRVVAIDDRDNTLYFTTRGDSNDKPDSFETSSEQVLGRVVSVGKFIGFPTVWISEVFNRG